VQGAGADEPDPDAVESGGLAADDGGGADDARPDPAGRRREVVTAFLTASRGGDFTALLELLDPEAVVLADAAAVIAGAEAEVRGAAAVAATFVGRAKAARLALLDGEPGLIWTHRGEVRMAFAFTVLDGRVAGIELIADPARIAAMGVEPLA
jgi:RNA polymerase sigma-70 factor (ECF subfamily)